MLVPGEQGKWNIFKEILISWSLSSYKDQTKVWNTVIDLSPQKKILCETPQPIQKKIHTL